MTMSDPLGDINTHPQRSICPEGRRCKSRITFSYQCLDVLKREGYIRDYSSVEVRPGI